MARLPVDRRWISNAADRAVVQYQRPDRARQKE